MPESKLVFNAQSLNRALTRIAHEIAERNDAPADVALIGIQKGGVHLCARLSKILEEIWSRKVPQGVIDVSMHRDDIARRATPEVYPTHIPFDLEGKVV